MFIPSLEVGEHFKIIGPAGRWRLGSRGGWQPRVWSSYPGDPDSRRVRPSELNVNFGARFQALEVRTSMDRKFVSARVEVYGVHVWRNIAKYGVDWVEVVEPVRAG